MEAQGGSSSPAREAGACPEGRPSPGAFPRVLVVLGRQAPSEMSLDNSRYTFTAGLRSSLQTGPSKWERSKAVFLKLK